MRPFYRYRSMEPYAAQDGAPFSVAPLLDQSQVFDYGADAQYQFGGDYYGENELAGGADDSNDLKRRRIARVSPTTAVGAATSRLTALCTGVRHVPEEEDQV